jgi:hypothetical protein
VTHHLPSRNENCDIRIQRTTVSDQHAEIHVDGAGKVKFAQRFVLNVIYQILLKTVSKSNPIFVNNRAITGSVVLKDKDQITIGGRKMLFVAPK